MLFITPDSFGYSSITISHLKFHTSLIVWNWVLLSI